MEEYREMQPLVEARGIMKEYGGETVLAGCDLSIHAGQSVALMGVSGEGKSTLLSILGLLLSPSAGRLALSGHDITGMGDGELSRLRAETFGFVFQHTQLIGSLRAVDNILVPACFGGADRNAAARRAAHLIKRFGLGHRTRHFPHQLSVGQKRRVALARALVLAPAVLLADEPTNDLDEATAAVVADTLLGYPDETHAVVYVTHDPVLARQADLVLCLDDGVLSPQLAGDAVSGKGSMSC